jgi:AraC-like DNA-binding protein
MGVPLRTRAVAGPTAVSTYREFAADQAPRAVVACTWEGRGGWSRSLRVLPDGCADLIWDGEHLVVVGAHAQPIRHHLTGDAHNVGVRLRPGAAGAILGWPAAELPAGPLPLEAIWGAAAARGAEAQVAAGAALERLVTDRLATGATPDPLVLAAVDHLHAPRASVTQVARTVALSPRELRRRFRTHVGYGPRRLQRVLRFHAFLRRSGDGATLAATAADLGYADQAHLARECRALSGSPPSALLA